MKIHPFCNVEVVVLNNRNITLYTGVLALYYIVYLLIFGRWNTNYSKKQYLYGVDKIYVKSYKRRVKRTNKRSRFTNHTWDEYLYPIFHLRSWLFEYLDTRPSPNHNSLFLHLKHTALFLHLKHTEKRQKISYFRK